MSSKLVPCKACGQQVARRSKVCPACGRTRPAGGVPRWLFGITALSLVLGVGALVAVWLQVAAIH